MAKLGEKYEAVVVFSLKNGEEQVQNLVAKFSDLIKENAELVNVDEWGKRKLAYPINYEADGYYVVYNFDSKPDFPVDHHEGDPSLLSEVFQTSFQKSQSGRTANVAHGQNTDDHDNLLKKLQLS